MIANHALYFADLALRAKTGDGAGVLPGARCGRSSTRRTAWRRAPPRGSAGACRSAGFASCSGTSSARAARAATPLPARALDRDRPAGRGASRGARPRSRPPPAHRGRRRGRRRRPPRRSPPALVSSPRPSRAGATTSTSSRAGRSATVDDLGACLAVEDEDTRLVGGAGRARVGAGRRLRHPARGPLGADGRLRARLGDAGAAVPARAARARRGARGLAGLAVRLPRAGAPLRPARLPGAALGRLRRAPRRRGRRRSAASRRGGRSSSRRRTARSTSCADRPAPHIPYPRADPGRRAAGAAARALPGRGRHRCSWPRRRSGRASTSRASRSRSSSSTSCRSPRPSDPLVEARCERIAQAGGDWFAEYALPTAILQLRQGFGRLIRGHADRGVVAILDPRLRTKAYGRRFLEALPPAPLVGELGAVAAFLGAGSAQPPDTFFVAWPRRIASRHRRSDPSRRPRRTSRSTIPAGRS